MPLPEINSAIAKLEAQLKQCEQKLDHSITHDEILAKTRVILQELRKVSRELEALKKLKGETQ
jgi:hypothetical protein